MEGKVNTRWGRSAAPPGEGEVAELVAVLESEAIACTCSKVTSGDLRRIAGLLQRIPGPSALDFAADLLQRHPQPIPVSERLPGTDTQPWCWLGNVVDGGWEWHQRSPGILTFIRDSYTHWLPAHALPLPTTTITEMPNG